MSGVKNKANADAAMGPIAPRCATQVFGAGLNSPSPPFKTPRKKTQIPGLQTHAAACTISVPSRALEPCQKVGP